MDATFNNHPLSLPILLFVQQGKHGQTREKIILKLYKGRFQIVRIQINNINSTEIYLLQISDCKIEIEFQNAYQNNFRSIPLVGRGTGQERKRKL